MSVYLQIDLQMIGNNLTIDQSTEIVYLKLLLYAFISIFIYEIYVILSVEYCYRHMLLIVIRNHSIQSNNCMCQSSNVEIELPPRYNEI